VPPLLYCDSKKAVEFLDSPGLCLGIFAEGRYEDRQAQLCPGDRLFAYTDGISEASPDDRHLFGKRLPGFLTQHAALPNEDFLDLLGAGLDDFLGGTPPNDDYTLLSIQRVQDSIIN
jgi:sigma-B regulation protein RsbU (phosphoserine phosphatase)